jgi:DNA-binding GntR family transcriptional regulator
LSPAVEAFLKRSEPLVRGEGRVHTTHLPSQIANTVRGMIQFGELKPGDRIREIPLAERFDISRGPVRDALKILERDRIITLERRAGAVVRDLTAEELRSIFEIRAELTAYGMRRAAESKDRSEARVAALEEGAEVLGMIARDEDGAVSDYIQVRRRVSELIHELAGNAYVTRIMVDFEREIAVLWAGVYGKSRQERSSAGWRRIADAVRRRDGATAEAEGRRIVLESLEALIDMRNA